MKTILKLLLLLLVAGYLAYAAGTVRQPSEERVCQQVCVEVKPVSGAEYMDSSYVLSILRRSGVPLVDQQRSLIRLDSLEEMLTADPYVRSANLFHTDRNVLQIEVQPRDPLLMVMADGGEQYYMDGEGHTMPLGQHCLPVCVATGNISRQYATDHLLPLAEYLQSHPFWRHQVEQIHVASPQAIHLHPRAGHHTIVLGDDSHFKSKLDKMLTFYKEAIPHVGWNRYHIIDISYKGQVVCR